MELWKRFHEKEVSHSMAHYLQAVAALKRAKGYARVGDIAARLGVSKSGVTSMLRSLQGRGLIDHERYGCVELTPAGSKLAAKTRANRTVLTTFFTEVLGVGENVAEEDACMIEHLVSADSMRHLLRLTSFLQSDEPVAVELRRLLREDLAAGERAGDNGSDPIGEHPAGEHPADEHPAGEREPASGEEGA
jgi:DtxR family Mn-dependent transcriptional regulator